MEKINFRNDILPLKNKLYRLALRITLDSAEAEDIVQDTMIRVWHRKDEWEKFDSIEAYCLTVARNLAIDRSQTLESKNIQLNDDATEISDSHDPHELMEHDEQVGIIHQLMNLLPEKQRSVIQLRDIEGKNYKEIAEILDITEEQVKVNLFRGRQKIKQKYLEIQNYGL